MIEVTTAFKNAIADGSRKYLCYADVALSSGTTLHLTNADLWEGGFSKEDAVSDDGKFTALGATVMGSASISIKNIDDAYSAYDFTNAKVTLHVGLDGIASSKKQLGVYTVDETHYTESSISLTMLDNMEQFDRPYSGVSTTYPATLMQIVQGICTHCGVTLDPSCSAFAHWNYSIPKRPTGDGITCREVLGMAAAIAGYYCRCSTAGKLVLGWFDRTTLDAWRTAYAGGTATQLSGMHYFSKLFSHDISVDDVVISRLDLVAEREDAQNQTQQYHYIYPAGSTSSLYTISMEKNELFNACTDSQSAEILAWLAAKLIGLTFRRASVTHVGDPTIEAGDIAAVWDRKNRGYPILVTRTNFSPGDQQKTVCGAETPSRNSATRYGFQTKASAELTKRLNEEKSLRAQIEDSIRTAIANAAGLYYTEVVENEGTASEATIRYLHNYPDLEESPIQIMFSTAGIMVTANGTAAAPTWYGLTPSGEMLVNLLSTTGFSFSWGQGGTLTLGGDDNVNGQLRILNASGTEIGRWDKDGIIANSGGRLTSQNGLVYVDLDNNEISCSKIRTPNGTVVLDAYNANTFRMYNASHASNALYFTPYPNANSDAYISSPNGLMILGATSAGSAHGLAVGATELRLEANFAALYCLRYGSTTNWFGIDLLANSSGNSISISGDECYLPSNSYLNDASHKIAYVSSSARRYKRDIKPIEDEELNPHRLLELTVVQFIFDEKHEYEDMRGKTIPGIIAEDVEEVYPSAVIHDAKTGEVESWDERRLIPGMLALIQEQHEKIEDLESRLARLEGIIGKMDA